MVIKGPMLQILVNEVAEISMLCMQEVSMENEMMICSLEIEDEDSVSSLELENLLMEFKDIFAEPTALPPFKENQNHKFPL